MIPLLPRMEGYPGQQPTMTCPLRVRHHRHLHLNLTLRTWTFISVLTTMHLRVAKRHLLCTVCASDAHLLFSPRHVLLEANNHSFIEDFLLLYTYSIYHFTITPPHHLVLYTNIVHLSSCILHWVRK